MRFLNARGGDEAARLSREAQFPLLEPPPPAQRLLERKSKGFSNPHPCPGPWEPLSQCGHPHTLAISGEL